MLSNETIKLFQLKPNKYNFKILSSKETATKVHKFGHFQVRKVCRKLVGAEEADRRAGSTVDLACTENSSVLYFDELN